MQFRAKPNPKLSVALDGDTEATDGVRVDQEHGNGHHRNKLNEAVRSNRENPLPTSFSI